MAERGHEPSHRRGKAAVNHDALWGNRSRLIIVPLDGSFEATYALPVAKVFADLVGASIQAVYATKARLPAEELLRRTHLSREETQGVIVDQMIGQPARAVVKLASEKNAMLIVMTTRGISAGRGREMRPVVEGIVRATPCPVLLVHPELKQLAPEPSVLTHILVPLDGAPSSAKAITPALSLAEYSDSQVFILHVVSERERPAESGTLTTPRYLDQAHHEWPGWAREFVERFGTAVGQYSTPKPPRVFLRRGDPAAQVLQFAAEQHIELIVLAWNGVMDSEHGHVVKETIEKARCLVLLLRTETKPFR